MVRASGLPVYIRTPRGDDIDAVDLVGLEHRPWREGRERDPCHGTGDCKDLRRADGSRPQDYVHGRHRARRGRDRAAVAGHGVLHGGDDGVGVATLLEVAAILGQTPGAAPAIKMRSIRLLDDDLAIGESPQKEAAVRFRADAGIKDDDDALVGAQDRHVAGELVVEPGPRLDELRHAGLRLQGHEDRRGHGEGRAEEVSAPRTRFMGAVGMAIDLDVVTSRWTEVLLGVVAWMAVKGAVVYAIVLITSK